jgi:hypothetical protein
MRGENDQREIIVNGIENIEVNGSIGMELHGPLN